MFLRKEKNQAKKGFTMRYMGSEMLNKERKGIVQFATDDIFQ